ncbi:MAG: energy-coupling factor transporter transmembrane component T [Bryobacter sp.]|nr:energy-coupling factor transporter transmembrane component T [Bryobacter sp.]
MLLLAYLAALASVPVGHNVALTGLCVLPLGLMLYFRAPASLFAKAAYVLPFSFALAAVALLRGQTAAAVFFLFRSYVSILAVLLATHLVSTLELLRAMERLGAPRFLILVTEFLLRYLDVLRQEADAMRLAALCRGAAHSRLVAAASLGMLFVRSLERSTAIHAAMLARGFRGQFPRREALRWQWRDSLLLAGGLVILFAIRLSL